MEVRSANDMDDVIQRAQLGASGDGDVGLIQELKAELESKDALIQELKLKVECDKGEKKVNRDVEEHIPSLEEMEQQISRDMLEDEVCASGDQSSQPEWYLVMKSMVLVKAKASEDAENVCYIRQGQKVEVKGGRLWGKDGHAWVELTSRQLQRVSETPAARGFVIIDATHLNLGLLLQGPLPLSSAEEAEELHREDEQFLLQDRQRRQDEQHKLRKSVQAKRAVVQQRRKGEDLVTIKENCERIVQDEKRLRAGCSAVYRAVYDHAFVKKGSDPASDLIARISCSPGAIFYCSKNQWSGPTGGLWVQRSSSKHWILVEGPGFGVDGPMLLAEAQTKHYVRVSVHYISEIGDFRIFDTFLSSGTKIKTLKQQLCEATGLNYRSIMLVRNLGSGGQKDLLIDSSSLGGSGLSGKVTLYFMYMDSFINDFKQIQQ